MERLQGRQHRTTVCSCQCILRDHLLLPLLLQGGYVLRLHVLYS
jgi:hypothetical protein